MKPKCNCCISQLSPLSSHNVAAATQVPVWKMTPSLSSSLRYSPFCDLFIEQPCSGSRYVYCVPVAITLQGPWSYISNVFFFLRKNKSWLTQRRPSPQQLNKDRGWYLTPYLGILTLCLIRCFFHLFCCLGALKLRAAIQHLFPLQNYCFEYNFVFILYLFMIRFFFLQAVSHSIQNSKAI